MARDIVRELIEELVAEMPEAKDRLLLALQRKRRECGGDRFYFPREPAVLKKRDVEAAYRATGSISAAAEAVGVSRYHAWRLRSRWIAR